MQSPQSILLSLICLTAISFLREAEMNLKSQVNLILSFYTPLVFVHCFEFIFFFRNVPWSNKCRAAMTLVYCHGLYTYSVSLLSCSSHVLFFSCAFYFLCLLLISYIIHVYVVTHIQLLCPFLSLYDTILLSYPMKIVMYITTI